MVKIEEWSEDEFETKPFIHAAETNKPGSSSGPLRSYFIGMGFSPSLVDKVFEKNGGDDAELLLEALLTESKSPPEASTSLEDFIGSDNEEADSHLGVRESIKVEAEDPTMTSTLDHDKRLYLLSMNFSAKEVDFAINQLGENASIAELVDCIVTSQGQKDFTSPIDNGSAVNEEHAAESLFGLMEKTQYLFQMGFSENEVSSAIDKFGPEVSIMELADSIFASRLRAVKEETQSTEEGNANVESDGITHIADESTNNDYFDDTWEAKPSTSNVVRSEEVRAKKAKGVVLNNVTSSYSYPREPRLAKDEAGWSNSPSKSNLVKEEFPEQVSRNIGENCRGILSNPPYFFYGNVVEVPRDTWGKLSQFLYGTQPEFANTEFFSAIARKEGYIHNLPSGAKKYIIPKPPMTIEDAIPHTRRWWPAWDTRKQLSCITVDSTGARQMCDQLGQIMASSRGILSKEQQEDILQNCKRHNLVWIGQYKLSPIEPEQFESILGYPRNHTNIWGMDRDVRLGALKYCFQVDTVGYYLSVLKTNYPDGLRVLSLCTGIGGAEVALCRLGIHLRCLVSVDASEVNRKILRRWWETTGQSGRLVQVAGIEKLTHPRLEELVQQFGGFDIIIGQNQGGFVSGTSGISSRMGMDLNPYYEFVRVFQITRRIMGSNS